MEADKLSLFISRTAETAGGRGRREDGAEELERGEFINAVFRRRRYDGGLLPREGEEETGGERKARPPSILSLSSIESGSLAASRARGRGRK